MRQQIIGEVIWNTYYWVGKEQKFQRLGTVEADSQPAALKKARDKWPDLEDNKSGPSRFVLRVVGEKGDPPGRLMH